MLTICRWWTNPAKSNPNTMISRTLGKIAFIDHNFILERPDDGEFWLSSVTREFASPNGEAKGCFIAEPIKRYQKDQLRPLKRSNCTVNTTNEGRTLIIEPVETYGPNANQPIPWILPLFFREDLKSPKVTSIVVNLGGESWTRIVR